MSTNQNSLQQINEELDSLFSNGINYEIEKAKKALQEAEEKAEIHNEFLSQIKPKIPALKEELLKMGLEISDKIISNVVIDKENGEIKSKALKFSFNAKPVGSKFKFISDKGYTAKGSGVNQKTIRCKS